MTEQELIDIKEKVIAGNRKDQKIHSRLPGNYQTDFP